MSSLVLFGDTSGSISLTANAVAGSNIITVPASTGTMLTSASSATLGTSMVLLGSGVASNSANISFTGLSLANYSALFITANNVLPATNAVTLQCQMSTGGTFQTTGYAHVEWRWVASASAASGNTSDTQINISSSGDTMTNNATYGNAFSMYVYGPSQTSRYKQYTSQFSGVCSDYVGVNGAGMFKYTTAVDGIRFYMSGGNISTGNFYLYGVKNI